VPLVGDAKGTLVALDRALGDHASSAAWQGQI
jgi:hypothetical protein